MELRTDIVGVILAGGKSSRMGQNKAMLEFRGKPFIQHIAETLKEIFEEVIIISDDTEAYKFLYLPVYVDVYKNCGPLGGIHSAFINSNTENIFVASCDLPFINFDVVRFLIDHHSHNEVTVFSVDQQIQPLFGLYNRSCFLELENHLKQKRCSVLQFINNIHANVIQLKSSLAITFSENLKNVNTLEDYQALFKDKETSEILNKLSC
ncbi:MAG: molybdenum cofactor guanylyltransferase [Bacteroidota bacterium]|nr:molybdenum cofactor guanylyltransferase [Bacteroidota bacterium]